MSPRALRPSFIAFHLTLGLVILLFSVETARAALAPDHGARDPHVFLLAAVEAVGALLFVLPWTLRPGGFLMLLTFALAFAIHATRGEVRADLLIYAAGTWFVMVHGSGWRPRAPRTAAA